MNCPNCGHENRVAQAIEARDAERLDERAALLAHAACNELLTWS